MVYLTHYAEYPIYEPAEGGYYYSGNEIVETKRLSLRQAKREMQEIISEAKAEHGDNVLVSSDKRIVRLRSKYIGEGESICIERKCGSHKRGRVPYC